MNNDKFFIERWSDAHPILCAWLTLALLPLYIIVFAMYCLVVIAMNSIKAVRSFISK